MFIVLGEFNFEKAKETLKIVVCSLSRSLLVYRVKPISDKKYFRFSDQSKYCSRIVVFPTYLLNLVKLEIAPFDPPTPKTPP